MDSRRFNRVSSLSLSAPTVEPTSILVVAEHALVRGGLVNTLAANPGLRIVGEAESESAAIDAAVTLRPEVVLFTGSPCSRTVARLRSLLPGTCVLSLSTSAGSQSDVLSVPSTADVDELCDLLSTALDGRCAGCEFRARCPIRRMAVALSRRETQVAVCVARGMSSKQIAATLGIALRTVNTYRESLARKVGASSAAVLTRFVLENRLDRPVPH